MAKTPNPEPRGGTHFVRGRGGDVLLLSMRGLSDLVAYCLQYEFEDVIADVAGADRINVGGWEALELSRRAYKLARLTTGSQALARAFAPRPSTFFGSRQLRERRRARSTSATSGGGRLSRMMRSCVSRATVASSTTTTRSPRAGPA